MTRTQSRMTVVLVAMLVMFGIMIASTSYSHAATEMLITDGQTITQDEIKDVDYFKFKAKESGSVFFSIDSSYENSGVYIKENGKYKKITKGDGQFFYITKGKYYYVKYTGLQLLEPSTEVYIDTYDWKDGGAKKSKAKSVRFNKYPEDMTGYMTYYNKSNDWYKFKITKTQKVNLQVLCTANQPKCVAKNTATLYKGSKKLASKTFRKNSILFAKKLKPGTYYLKVKRGSKLNNMRFGVTLCKSNYKWVKNLDMGDDPAMAADFIKKKIK